METTHTKSLNLQSSPVSARQAHLIGVLHKCYALLKLRLFWILCVTILVGLAYLIGDYYGPREIPLHEDRVWGLPCLRAKDLLVQEYDPDGNIWATRGMVTYRLSPGESKFVRQYRIPTGLSVFWFRNFSIVRRLTLRPECAEVFPMPNGDVCAMSAGRMWHRPARGGDFEKTLTLRHYGIGVGQGIRNAGLARLEDGTIMFGEYFLNRHRRSNVRLYASCDSGRTWQVAREFRPGQIRHIHAVQQDPYTQKAWICTGDRDPEAMVAWTEDAGKTLNPIGQGSPVWRVCQLVFTKTAVFWGTDTGDSVVRGIYRWDRETGDMTKLVDVPGKIFYAIRLAKGTIIMSTVAGARDDKNETTQLWVIADGEKVAKILAGTRASERKKAKLRFQRDQGGVSLCLTCLNHKEFNDGDLIIIAEQALRTATDRADLES